MKHLLLIQYRSSLAIIEHLQQHDETGGKYELYEQHKQQLMNQIQELTDTTGSQSRPPFKDAFGPASRLPAVVLERRSVQ